MSYSLLWRVPVAATCLAMTWHLVNAIFEEAEADGFGAHHFIGLEFALILVILGTAALAPQVPKALFNAAVKWASKHLAHLLD